MSATRSGAGYKSTWAAWAVLLALTVAMMSTSSRALVLGGIGAKSAIIGAWFMHLRWEKPVLVWTVAIGGLFFVLFLFFLLSFDAAPPA
jgi:cytochrome c oxidase subunit IV